MLMMRGVSRAKDGINLVGNMKNVCLVTMQKNEHWNTQETYSIQQLLNLQRNIMGKGSTPRKFSVSNEEYASRWDAIFGKDNEKKDKTQTLESDRPDSAQHSGSSDNIKGQTGQAKTS
jgi:hypothetical protein